MRYGQVDIFPLGEVIQQSPFHCSQQAFRTYLPWIIRSNSSPGESIRMWLADVKPCFLDKTLLVMEEHLCVAGINALKFWKGFAPVVSTGIFCQYKLTNVEEWERRWQHIIQVNSLYKDEWQLMVDKRRLESQACWDGLEPRGQLLHTTEQQILRVASLRKEQEWKIPGISEE